MMPSTPGRQVRFLQGHAVIKHGRDLVAMMLRPDVKIQLTPFALSWLDTFLAEAGDRMKAEVQWPERTSRWDPKLREGVLSGPGGQEPDPGTQ